MLTIAGYDLPEVVHEDAESVTWRGRRVADGLRVRVRVPRATVRPSRAPAGEGERVVAVELLGTREAVVVEDDGALPATALLADGPLPIARALALARDVAAALARWHDAGVVHGRLSLDAVWTLPADDRVVLLDAAPDPRYRAPDAGGTDADARSDLYAVGVLLHHLLAGAPPFESDDALTLQHAHAARRPPDVREARPEVPEAVASVVTRLLAKAQSERYQSAFGLLADLRALEAAVRGGRATEDVPLGVADRAAVFAPPERLYGRDAEREALRAALDRARWGRVDPLLLSGAPGVGKSALAAELRADVRALGGRFCSGKFDQYKRNVPYSAVAEAFTAFAHELLGEPEAQVAEWRERVHAAVGANGRVLADVAPDAALLVGELPPVPTLGPVESRYRLNATFREFVRVFASPDRPLVVLLDDLQWADAASLSLFTALGADATLPHLLLLGAYRDSEVDAAHLLTSAVEELRGAGAPPLVVAIGPIQSADTAAIVADTLSLTPGECADLAAAAHERTGGNPFFLHQFLRALYDERVLRFDAADARWRWDADAVRDRDYSENVVTLMAGRLRRLPEDARAALRVASCVGATFATRVVASALGFDEARAAVALRVASSEGLVEPRTSASPSGGSESWRFVHDRVQQAAHGLIAPEERPALRRRIGRVMREVLAPEELSDALFEIVSNLSEGLAEVRDPAEREELARLALEAGRRARAALAYDDARRFLRTGIDAAEGTAAERELGFALRSELFECEYLTSRFAEADALFERLLLDSPDPMSRAQLYNTKILVDTSQGRSEAAVRLGITAVRELGVRMPARPTLVHVLWELLRVQLAVRGRPTAALLELPRMGDPTRTAAIGILMRIGPAAYFNDPETLLLSALTIVRLSLRHGNARGSSFGYVIYAMVLGAKFGRPARGHEFGRLAVALSDRLDTADVRSKVHLIFGNFVNSWTQPWRTSVRHLAEAFPIAVEAGDPQYAGYCHNSIIFQELAFGAPLTEVQAAYDAFVPFVMKANDDFTVQSFRLARQHLRALAGDTRGLGTLTDDEFDEDAWVREIRAGRNLTTLGYYQTAKVRLAFLARDLATAARVGEEGWRNREALLSQICSAEVPFYYGLTLAALLRAPATASTARRRALAACRKAVAAHARGAPSNFEPWRLLLEAEATGGDAALALYDRAVDAARQAGQPNVHGLAAELAARSQLALGRRTVAESYLRDAIAAYERWQSTAKVRQLVTEFAELLPERALAPRTVPVRSSAAVHTAADLESAMRAAHALASETSLDRVLERLLEAALMGSGADAGRVVIAADDGLFVDAVADTERGVAEVLRHTPLAEAAGICAPVVQTVARRRAPVVLADALIDPQFGGTPDVRARRPRSIACLPIVRADRLLGMLYVENTLAPGAFTAERVRLLALMASEVAIAVDRARLSDEARSGHEALGEAMRRVELLEKSKAHLGKFVPASVQRLIDADPDAPALEKRERDVSILFLDIEGYTRLTESLPRERLDWLVRTYFSRFLDVVHEHHGEVNETAGDGLMILFQDDDPRAHAANACRAALAIGRAARALGDSLPSLRSGQGSGVPVVVNVGVNSGAALVGATRLQGSREARYTFTATGAATNVAARLGAFATGGAAVVSETTASRIGDEFALEPLGAQRLKNVSEPLVVYRLLDRAPADGGPAPTQLSSNDTVRR